MKHFFCVIKGKNIVRLVFLMFLLAITFWYVFQLTTTNNEQVSSLSWSQFAPRGFISDEQQQENEIVEVFSISNLVDTELNGDTEVVTVKPVPTKFSEYRMERERIRSRQVELLENMIDDKMLSQDRRYAAQQELLETISLIAKEVEIENLLKAKGYLDVVVILSEEAVTVVVPITLSQAEATRVGELVNRLTGVRLDQITIIDELTKS